MEVMIKNDDPDIKKFQMAWLGAPGMRIAGGTDEILEITTTGKMIPPAQRFPKLNVPHSLSAVVMKAVSLDQDERYNSVIELRNEVYNYLAGFATSAENASFMRGLTLLYKRNKLICNITFILCPTRNLSV